MRPATFKAGADPPSQAAVDEFARLYDAYYPDILAYISRRWPDRTEAHDVVADVFLVAWRRRADIPRGDAALHWLYGVARRVLANHERSRTRRLRLVRRFEQLPLIAPDVEGARERNAQIGRLVAALGKLSADDREVLLLAAWEELGAKEIAAVVGCSENAASIRLHRARKRLTNVYEKENGGSGDEPFNRLRLRRPAEKEGDADERR